MLGARVFWQGRCADGVPLNGTKSVVKTHLTRGRAFDEPTAGADPPGRQKAGIQEHHHVEYSGRGAARMSHRDRKGHEWDVVVEGKRKLNIGVTSA